MQIIHPLSQTQRVRIAQRQLDMEMAHHMLGVATLRLLEEQQACLAAHGVTIRDITIITAAGIVVDMPDLPPDPS